MDKPYRVTVFGKAGCPKCKTLNRRVEKLLSGEDWQEFERHYCDIETEDGLLEFCRSECVNPSRIPAMVVMRREENGRYAPVESAQPGAPGQICGQLYQYVGLQTDYNGAGRGVISPTMIEEILTQARAS